jgi:PHD/YefM family antitoxin component YafN of YafNO toxin-antitoxin module
MSIRQDFPKFPNSSKDAEDRRLPHVLGRAGKPEVVVIPYDAYLQLQETQKEQILASFDRLMERLGKQNAVYTDEEVASDVEKAQGR